MLKKKNKKELELEYEGLDKRSRRAKEIKRELKLFDVKPNPMRDYEIPDFDSILNSPKSDEIPKKEAKKILKSIETVEVDDESYLDVSQMIGNTGMIDSIIKGADAKLNSIYLNKTGEELFGKQRDFERTIYIQIIKLNLSSLPMLMSPLQAFALFSIYYYGIPVIKVIGVRKNETKDDDRTIQRNEEENK